ncbi:MAG: hypothetical protein JWN70_2030 [Planctomycetaceae bacterium]|nr:hypothetical protein [Planctomycetaceae bacterium]
MLFANVGLPMICVELPFLTAALLPVVLLESAVYRWRLSVTWKQSVWGTLRANLWSTFVGVPLAWLVQTVCQLVGGGGGIWDLDTPINRLASVTLQSAWLVPHMGEYDWMIPAAALCLLLPCLIVSVAVEHSLLLRYWPGVPVRQMFGVAVLANVLSYVILAAYWSVQLFKGLAAHQT